MSASNRNHPSETIRCESTDEEQTFCNQAIESGEYDLVSDRAWVSECEGIAAKARFEQKQIKATEREHPDEQLAERVATLYRAFSQNGDS